MKKKATTIAKCLYERFTPYVQVGAWVSLILTTGVTGLLLMEKAIAFDGRISDLERSRIATNQKLETIDGKLDVVIQFTKPRR